MRAKKEMTMKQIGSVAVDSGQLLIVDPCQAVTDADAWASFAKWRERVDPEGKKGLKPINCSPPTFSFTNDLATYDEMCEITLGAEGGGNAKKVFNEDGSTHDWKSGVAGVVSRTAYGDDLYPVFQVFDDGELMGLYVSLDGLHNAVFGRMLTKNSKPWSKKLVDSCKKQATKLGVPEESITKLVWIARSDGLTDARIARVVESWTREEVQTGRASWPAPSN